MNTFRLLLAAVLTSVTLVAHAKPPVSFEATLEPDTKDPSHLSLLVTIKIDEGWHMYADVPEGVPYLATKVVLDLPKSIQKDGDLVAPPDVPYAANPAVTVYEGTIVFSQELKVQPSEKSPIGVTIKYQLCDEKKCLPPATWDAKVAVPSSGSGDSKQEPFAFANKYFSAPERLMVRGRPLQGSLPSPSLYDLDGDGRAELLIGNVTGSIVVYSNEAQGPGEPRWSMGQPLKLASGKPVSVNNWCCVGMTPQQLDLNGDGLNDLIVGCFEGVPQFIEGTKSGFLAPTAIKDAGGNALIIDEYFDVPGNKWTSSDRAGGTGHCTSIVAADWDADGDFDLILGDKKMGRSYLRLNQGSATKPSFSTKNELVMAGDEPMICEGGLSTSRIVDWDGDGLFDILSGGVRGGIYFSRNIGTKGKPAFAASECLITPVVKHIYDDLVPVVNGEPAMPGSFYHLEAYDYDRDGDLDLLVGGLCSWANPDFKPRTEQQEKELAAQKDELLALRAKLPSNLTPQETEARVEFLKSKEGKAVSARMRELQNALLQAERAVKSSGNFVWLFRRK